MKIAIDAMGGDYGAEPIVRGCILALKEKKFEPVLVGNRKEIEKYIPKRYKNKIEIIETIDCISMDGQATDALKRKDSSIYKCIDLVKTGVVSGVVSAGHSGATMTLATLKLGRIKGVKRPALITLMPTESEKKTVLLDVGANVDSKSEHLTQFAIMGGCYSEFVLGVKSPKIGILANGEEEGKGNEVTKTTYKNLKNYKGFIGNVEGSDIFNNSCDVITCDGFTGNLVLKSVEGVSSTINKLIKSYIKKSPIAITGALLMRKVFKLLKKQTDYAEIGGAPLIGIKGSVVVSHGKSNQLAIKNAIFQSINYVNANLDNKIEDALILFEGEDKKKIKKVC